MARFSFDLPDYDQRWSLDGPPPRLPNGGLSYCAPTAALDVACFLSTVNRGALLLTPPPVSQPGQITDLLLTIGSFVGTSSQTGTLPSDFRDGLGYWFKALTPPGRAPQWEVHNVMFNRNVTVDISAIVSWLQFGALLMPWIGWYYWSPLTNAWNRNGGHVVALAGLEDTPGKGWRVSLSDPWREVPLDKSEQSPFKRNDYGLEEVIHKFGIAEEGAVDQTGTLPRLANFDSLHQNAFIDGVTLIAPRSLFYTPKISTGAVLKAGLGVAALPVSWATPGQLVDVAYNPARPEVAFLTVESRDVRVLDANTGQSRILATLTEAGSAPRRLAFGGRDNLLYVLNGSELVALDASGAVVGSRASEQIRDLAAIAWSGAAGRLLAFSPRANRIVDVPLDPRTAIGGVIEVTTRHKIELPLHHLVEREPATAARLSVAPDNGALWLLFDGHRVAHRWEWQGAGFDSSTLVDFAAPLRGLQALADETLVTTADGVLTEFHHDPLAGIAQPAPARVFRPVLSEPTFAVAPAFDNFNRAKARLAAYFTVPPRR